MLASVRKVATEGSMVGEVDQRKGRPTKNYQISSSGFIIRDDTPHLLEGTFVINTMSITPHLMTTLLEKGPL